MTYERVDHPVEPLTHPLVPEQPWPAYRSVVVDDVEWLGGGFERTRERTADAVGQPAEDPYQNQQPHDDQVAEEHVEQQLPVGPLRAVRRPAQLGHGSGVQETVKRLPCLLHLGADDLSIHLITSLPTGIVLPGASSIMAFLKASSPRSVPSQSWRSRPS